MKSEKLPISSIAKIISGGTPKTSVEEYWNGSIPWLSVKDFNNGNKYVYSTEKHISELGFKNSSTNVLSKDDIIISARGTVGELAMIPFDMTFNQSCFGIRANKEKCLPDYLYYALKNNIQTIKGSTHGSVFDTITLKDFEIIKIPVPDLKAQKKIVRILSDLDQKIELNNQQNSLILEKLKMNYRAFLNGLCDEKQIPLQDVFNFQEGPGIRNWQYVEKEGTKFINIRCIKDDDLDLSTANMISNEEACGKYAHFMLNEDDVVVSTSGTLGRSQIIRKIHLPLCLNTSVIRFWPKEPDYYSYMYCYLISDEFLHNLDVMATGSAQRNFGPMHLKQININMPNKAQVGYFEKTNRSLIKKLCLNRDENMYLKSIRDTLLPKLMSGEINLEGVKVDK